jgi:hypothetical protein
MGFMFSCEACDSITCLMCNHTLYNGQPHHSLKTYYMFETGNTLSTLSPWIQVDFILLAHTCSPNLIRSFYEVELPYAFDLQLHGWQKWLRESKDKLRDTCHEEKRKEAVARNPLRLYELMFDRCDGSY